MLERHAGTFRRLSRSWRRSGLMPPRGVKTPRGFWCGIRQENKNLLATNWTKTKTKSDKSRAALSAGLVVETEEIDSKINFANCSDDNKSHSQLIPLGKLDSLTANHSRVKGQAPRSRRSEETELLSHGKQGSNTNTLWLQDDLLSQNIIMQCFYHCFFPSIKRATSSRRGTETTF